MIVSRAIGPRSGTASTLLNSIAAVVGMGFFAYAFVVSGLQPMMAMIGTTSGGHWFLSAATSLTHHGWQAFAAIAFLAVGVAICAGPIRITMRVQAICAIIAMAGFILGLLVLWFTSKGQFISNYNHYAGADAYQKATAAGGVAQYNFHDTVLAIGTIAAYTVFQWWSMYFAGEIKALERRSLATMLIPTFVYFASLLLMIGTWSRSLITASSSPPILVTRLIHLRHRPSGPFWRLFAVVALCWAVLFGATFLFWFPLLAMVSSCPPFGASSHWDLTVCCHGSCRRWIPALTFP